MNLDYYAILDVPRTATIYDIQLSYRKLALRLHPQRKKHSQHPNPPPEAPLQELPEKSCWELLNEAYDVLSNPMLREVYDKYGEEGLKNGAVTPIASIPPYFYHGDLMRTYFEFFGSLSPYTNLIHDPDLIVTAPKLPCLNNTEKGRDVKNKDPVIERLLYLELEEVFHGGLKLVKIFRHEFVDEPKTKTEQKEITFSVPIAPGILEGTQLIFPEAGDQSAGRIPSDIKFYVCDKKHKTFRRDKSDLHLDYKVSLKEALTGFKMTVKTTDDRKLEILITDVVDCNYTKRILSEGLPFSFNNQRKGDLYIHFQVEFPTYVPKCLKTKLADVFDDVAQYLVEKETTKCCVGECQQQTSSPSANYQVLQNFHVYLEFFVRLLTAY